MFMRFPGAFLMQMFTPFTFGPTIPGKSCNSCSSRTICTGGFEYGKAPMEFSFVFTYINIVIMFIGNAFLTMSVFINARGPVRFQLVCYKFFPNFWIGVLASYPAQFEAWEAYLRTLKPKLRSAVAFSPKKTEKCNISKTLWFLSKTETLNDFEG